MAANRHDRRLPGEHHVPDPNDPSTLHESIDVNAKSISKFGIGIVLLTIFSLAVVLGVFKAFEKIIAGPRPYRELQVEERNLPPKPRLQELPVRDLAAFEAAENQVLNNYGWVDKQKGTVHLPIDRAMELYLQRAPATRSQADIPQASAVSIPTESGLGPKVQNPGGPLTSEPATAAEAPGATHQAEPQSAAHPAAPPAATHQAEPKPAGGKK
jgi:hypothetical protein